MALGGKILFMGAIVTALLMARSAAAAPVQPGFHQPYVPPAPSPQNNANAAIYPNAHDLFWKLMQKFTIIFDAKHNPLTAAYGVKQIRDKGMVLDSTGHLIQSQLLPFMKISAGRQVAAQYCGMDLGTFIFSGTTCPDKGFCTFPFDVYQTWDGYYIAVFADVSSSYPYTGLPGQHLVVLTDAGWTGNPSYFGAALYDPNMKYVAKATLPNALDSYYSFDLSPPLSPEYRSSNSVIQCH